MVSFTSRKPSFFSPATGLLVLALALHCSSSPVNKRETTEEDPIREELYWGTRLLTQINNDSVFTNMGITQKNISNLLPIVS